MNKNQVSQQNVETTSFPMPFKRILSPIDAIQVSALELMQEECEEDMVNFIRAKREGRARRAAIRERKAQNQL